MPMSVPVTLVNLERRDREAAAWVLVEAFRAEPWLRWTVVDRRDEHSSTLRALLAFSCDVGYEMGWPRAFLARAG